MLAIAAEVVAVVAVTAIAAALGYYFGYTEAQIALDSLCHPW